jgi:hypothetical protein
MSGAEFIAVAGVISSIIAIAGGIKKVVDVVSEAEGLPKAFRQAANKLPLISDILEATKRNFEKNDVSGVEKSVALVIDGCKNKWTTLHKLFEKIIPREKASCLEICYKAAKTVGKEGKVGSLMKGMLEDIQLLATIKTMTTKNGEMIISTMTGEEKEKVAQAIVQVTIFRSPTSPWPEETSKRGTPKPGEPESKAPKEEKKDLVKSTLDPIIEKKFGQYSDSRGKNTFEKAVGRLKDKEYGSGFVSQLGSHNFDPHKAMVEAIRYGYADVVWALLYRLRDIKKECSVEHYSGSVMANWDSRYRHFPKKINMYYHSEAHSLLELAFKGIQLDKNMEDTTLIFMMFIACGADINNLHLLTDSPTERECFEDLKRFLDRVGKGSLLSMEPGVRAEEVLSMFHSMWIVKDERSWQQYLLKQERRRQQNRLMQDRLRQLKQDQLEEQRVQDDRLQREQINLDRFNEENAKRMKSIAEERERAESPTSPLRERGIDNRAVPLLKR